MRTRPRMYEGLPSEVRLIIDDTFISFTSDLKAESYGSENGDQAELLIDQLTEFFLCSNPSFRGVVYTNACYYESTNEYAKGCG